MYVCVYTYRYMYKNFKDVPIVDDLHMILPVILDYRCLFEYSLIYSSLCCGYHSI